jgi:hypothetical protein
MLHIKSQAQMHLKQFIFRGVFHANPDAMPPKDLFHAALRVFSHEKTDARARAAEVLTDRF